MTWMGVIFHSAWVLIHVPILKISYCSTCKGRLWQLRQTLPGNLDKISRHAGVDLVLLDYHSNDGLSDYIFGHFQDYLDSGILKYYRLITQKPYFNTSYAKNLAHCLATGDVLFNLDADNFVGETLEELKALKPRQLLVNQMFKQFDRGGRIGIHAQDFHALRGYNESMKDGFDDGDLFMRAIASGFRTVKSKDTSIPISNTPQQKSLYLDPNQSFTQTKTRNPGGYGCAQVLDDQGAVLDIGFK